MSRKKIAVVGATGYTGSEIVRILTHHPEVEISMITSESHTGKKFSDIHPFFQGIVDDTLVSADQVEAADLDLVFLALPHGVSMKYVERFAGRSFRIVDFSGDFRLSSPEVYRKWYQKEHSYVAGFDTAVYGMPELFANEISDARLVANPGCFPTGAILSLAPLVAANAVETSGIIIDSKTGVTGAGIKSTPVNMFSNVNDNFKAYGLKKHRHTIEIQNILEKMDGELSPVQFTPHLLPVDRGILTTVYARPAAGFVQKSGAQSSDSEKRGAQNTGAVEPGSAKPGAQISSAEKQGSTKPETQSTDTKSPVADRYRELFHDFYKDKPFVRICDHPPAIKDVRASNYCNIYIDFDERTGNVMVISAIDNLVKGAAGLAVQNMNIMLGFGETAGLGHIPVNP